MALWIKRQEFAESQFTILNMRGVFRQAIWSSILEHSFTIVNKIAVQEAYCALQGRLFPFSGNSAPAEDEYTSSVSCNPFVLSDGRH
jgi:hypothetical protein